MLKYLRIAVTALSMSALRPAAIAGKLSAMRHARQSLISMFTATVVTCIAIPSTSAVTLEFIGQRGQALSPHFLSPDGRNVFVHMRGGEPFFWSRDTGPIPIELPDNHGMVSGGVGSASADGRVLMVGGVMGRELPNGALQVDARVGFRWEATTGFTQLDELPGGPDYTMPRDISADGTVIVGSSESDVGIEAVRWTHEGQVLEPMGYLGVSSGSRNVSTPTSTSANGSVIVGSSSKSDGSTQAFRWTESSGMTQLDTSPFPSIWSRANNISPDGTKIVGEVDSAFEQPHQAFLWDSNSGNRALGWLPIKEFGYSPSDPLVTLNDSWARAVSDDGHIVVGTSGIEIATDHGPITTFQSEYLPFVWTPSTGMMLPLEFLEQEYDFAPGDLKSLAIEDVSADGRTLLGIGHDQDNQQLTMLIHLDGGQFAPGDFNGDFQVNAADYVAWRKSDGTHIRYVEWRANFGKTASSKSLSNATVPEPANAFMLIWGPILAIGKRIRRAWQFSEYDAASRSALC